MPDVSEIIAGVTRAANDLVIVAIAWHAVAAAVLIALLLGWRPSCGRAVAALAAPVLSVSAAAWWQRNPVNGTTFLLLAGALVWASRSAARGGVSRGPTWAFVVGALMIALGWLYPHFLVDRSPLAYLYAAPTGLLPCPTLCLVIGLALVGGGLGSRTASLFLAGFGLLYGIVGATVLGVAIDLALLVGAAALLALVIRREGRLPLLVED